MKRRLLAVLLLGGSMLGFASGFAEIRHAHRDAPCHQAREAAWTREGPPVLPDHLHDAEGRVYVRPHESRSGPRR